jgi:DNA modification methylase
MSNETYLDHERCTIHCGDSLAVLKALPDESVNCCVTSPPYWGLRDYGTAEWEGGEEGCDHKHTRGTPNSLHENMAERPHGGSRGGNSSICQKGCGAKRIDSQLGLEPTPEEYVANMVALFREVRRVLRDDGTLWLNLGDSYNGSGGAGGDYGAGGLKEGQPKYAGRKVGTLKPKDLCGIPWRVALALQADGWWLRQDIIWHKPNPMPESVTDRCTKAHEYIFLMSKSAKYFYDADAVREKASQSSVDRWAGDLSARNPAHGNSAQSVNGEQTFGTPDNGRNKRSVWTVTTRSYSGAHFATFPPKLIEPCILAGCPKGGTVLDPFMGSGTTAQVAIGLGCNAVGIELNPEYCDLIKRRLNPILEQGTLFVKRALRLLSRRPPRLRHGRQKTEEKTKAENQSQSQNQSRNESGPRSFIATPSSG